MRESFVQLNNSLLSRRVVLSGIAAGFIGSATGERVSASDAHGRWRHLERDAAEWNVWVDPGDVPPDSVFFDTPELLEFEDGSALKLAITGGARPYTHIHCYRTLDALPQATQVALRMDWKFSDTTWNNEGGASIIQMIEPAMNIWNGAERFEWALQWQNVADGSSEDLGAPAWRVWNGHSWEYTGISQRLEPNQWHHLELIGSLEGSRVRYERLVTDDIETALPFTFDATAAEEPARSAVTMQLGGNYRQDPYQCLVRNVAFSWKS